MRAPNKVVEKKCEDSWQLPNTTECGIEITDGKNLQKRITEMQGCGDAEDTEVSKETQIGGKLLAD